MHGFSFEDPTGGWQNVQSTETRLPSSFAPVIPYQGPAPTPAVAQSFPAPTPVEVIEHQPLKTEPVAVHVVVNPEKEEEFKKQANSLIHPARAGKPVTEVQF